MAKRVPHSGTCLKQLFQAWQVRASIHRYGQAQFHLVDKFVQFERTSTIGNGADGIIRRSHTVEVLPGIAGSIPTAVLTDPFLSTIAPQLLAIVERKGPEACLSVIVTVPAASSKEQSQPERFRKQLSQQPDQRQ